MDRRSFANTARRFWFLDRTDVAFLSDSEWREFRGAPLQFFLQTDEETKARIWFALTGGTDAQHDDDADDVG